jgi:hypothetical protein
VDLLARLVLAELAIVNEGLDHVLQCDAEVGVVTAVLMVFAVSAGSGDWWTTKIFSSGAGDLILMPVEYFLVYCCEDGENLIPGGLCG